MTYYLLQRHSRQIHSNENCAIEEYSAIDGKYGQMHESEQAMVSDAHKTQGRSNGSSSKRRRSKSLDTMALAFNSPKRPKIEADMKSVDNLDNMRFQ